MEAAANAKVEKKNKRVIANIEALDSNYRCWGWLGRLDSWSWGGEDIYIYLRKHEEQYDDSGYKSVSGNSEPNGVITIVVSNGGLDQCQNTVGIKHSGAR